MLVVRVLAARVASVGRLVRVAHLSTMIAHVVHGTHHGRRERIDTAPATTATAAVMLSAVVLLLLLLLQSHLCQSLSLALALTILSFALLALASFSLVLLACRVVTAGWCCCYCWDVVIVSWLSADTNPRRAGR